MELGSCKRNGCSWKIACWSLNCSRIQWIHATHMLMILPMFINVLLYVPGVIDIPTYYILLWYIFCFVHFFLKHWRSISLDTLARRAMGEVVGLECALAELVLQAGFSHQRSYHILPSLKLTDGTWKWMVGRWYFPFLDFSIFSRATLLLGRASL